MNLSDKVHDWMSRAPCWVGKPHLGCSANRGIKWDLLISLNLFLPAYLMLGGSQAVGHIYISQLQQCCFVRPNLFCSTCNLMCCIYFVRCFNQISLFNQINLSTKIIVSIEFMSRTWFLPPLLITVEVIRCKERQQCALCRMSVGCLVALSSRQKRRKLGKGDPAYLRRRFYMECTLCLDVSGRMGIVLLE